MSPMKLQTNSVCEWLNIYDPGQRVKVILNPNDIMAYAPSAEEVE